MQKIKACCAGMSVQMDSASLSICLMRLMPKVFIRKKHMDCTTLGSLLPWRLSETGLISWSILLQPFENV